MQEQVQGIWKKVQHDLSYFLLEAGVVSKGIR